MRKPDFGVFKQTLGCIVIKDYLWLKKFEDERDSQGCENVFFLFVYSKKIFRMPLLKCMNI